ncbi:hypothetical protein JAAARDRAFT_66557 [Jaapia argillacea MUCL 33604]|uniref:Fork-head domain-containing protein n=1 Tax=Jaapia argillacea MUCL 33604 TaxID=933084 RepID=A0A067Q5P3_9AGAM|nr:hypothetical protein JAAARDRAFT_66557 [Jaapia argillacea MUCL 33604]
MAEMAGPHAVPSSSLSPVSELLKSMGMTREDLSRHSEQMKQFLTAENAPSFRVFAQENSAVQDRRTPASVSVPRSRSNSVADASVVHRTTPPPVTPVKTEPIDIPMPSRQMDSMEMIIERKNRMSKKERRGRRERERTLAPPPSPSPSQSNCSLDIFMHSRGVRRVDEPEMTCSLPDNSPQEAPPVTPQHHRYYREYSEPTTSRSRHSTLPSTTTTTTTTTTEPPSPILTSAVTANPFITPRKNNYYRSSLPPSSPLMSSPAASSPFPQRIVNLVSSPGPMGPAPSESDYDTLPFTLPPGPYSPTKPSHSYAALIGQAILASPNHRLTLQEIYEFITIVYPHFKRGGAGQGEQTWMNSIRHVLSTTAVFRKVSRDKDDGGFMSKGKGRTLWAIWDADLDCFRDGGFDKRFCKDMVSELGGKAPRKRAAPEDTPGGRRSKRAKKTDPKASAPLAVPVPSHPAIFSGPPPFSHAHPIFPPPPGFHMNQQPYYPAYVAAPPGHVLPAGVIFPPLPPSSQFYHIQPIPSTSSASASSSSRASTELSCGSPPPSSASSVQETPELMPHNGSSSSSSPPLASQGTSTTSPAHTSGEIVIMDGDDPDAFDALEPGFAFVRDRKGKAPQLSFPRPDSPLSRKSAARVRQVSNPTVSSPPTLPALPSTPPRNAGVNHVQLSPVRTPISHRGFHMSPSMNLSYYKTHLDPPPPPSFASSSHRDEAANAEPRAMEEPEHMRTPVRKRPSTSSSSTLPGGSSFPPVTPKRLVFPNHNTEDSPFRTPLQGSLFDPYDASAILDEELSRFGTQESPAGFFGREGRSLLYRSPDMPSPGRWPRLW